MVLVLSAPDDIGGVRDPLYDRIDLHRADESCQLEFYFFRKGDQIEQVGIDATDGIGRVFRKEGGFDMVAAELFLLCCVNVPPLSVLSLGR